MIGKIKDNADDNVPGKEYRMVLRCAASWLSVALLTKRSLQLRLIYPEVYYFIAWADAYRIKDQQVAYFIILTFIDWVMYLQEKNIRTFACQASSLTEDDALYTR